VHYVLIFPFDTNIQSKLRSICLNVYVLLWRPAIKSTTYEFYMKYFMDYKSQKCDNAKILRPTLIIKVVIMFICSNYIKHGPVKVNELRRIRRNNELEDIIKGANTVRFIKSQRIRLLGHIQRMQDTAIPKNMLYGKLYATRHRGRPKTRWLDDESTDLWKMGINERRDRARDREVWRLIVMEAKAHPGL
jgi:hypothetical protein